LTSSTFCPKSGEPNYKQTAIQLHSQKVPSGLRLSEKEITGLLEHQQEEQAFYLKTAHKQET